MDRGIGRSKNTRKRSRERSGSNRLQIQFKEDGVSNSATQDRARWRRVICVAFAP